MEAGQTGRKRRSRGRGEAGARREHNVYAALDLGTNNCRLLVAEPEADGFRVIDAFSRIVRLGEGLGKSGRLSQEAQLRALSGLKMCAAKMRRRGVTRARCVATEACRQAENGTAFLEWVAKETGLALDIISTEEEARLAVEGCGPLLDHGHRYAVVFDIGGGSTELMWLELDGGGESTMLGWTSLPVGVVTLAERFAGESNQFNAFEAMVQEVGGLLAPFESRYGLLKRIEESNVQMLGTSGTVTTLAGVNLGLENYDRSKVDGIWVEFDELNRVAVGLLRMNCTERAAVGCVGRGRADLVVPGCAILEAIRSAWPVGRLRVADRGLREGLLVSMIRQDARLAAASAAAD